MAICENCGAYLNDNDNFCELCGSAVSNIISVIYNFEKEKNERERISGELKDLRNKLVKTNTEISRLKNELDAKDKGIENTQTLQRAAGILKNKLAAAKSAKNAAIVFWLISLVLAVGIAYGIYSDLEGRYRDLSIQENRLQQSYDQLLSNYSNSMRWWPISITDIVVQNWDEKNTIWLSEPGQSINAAEMKYFNVKINFVSKVYGDFDFYVKLFDPYGRLFTNESSPSGYSFFSKTYNIYPGNGQSKDLDGIPGTFSQGQWTVEIWLDDVRISDKTIALN